MKTLFVFNQKEFEEKIKKMKNDEQTQNLLKDKIKDLLIGDVVWSLRYSDYFLLANQETIKQDFEERIIEIINKAQSFDISCFSHGFKFNYS